MRGQSSKDLVLVLSHCIKAIDIKHFVGVYSHQNSTNVGINEVAVIPEHKNISMNIYGLDQNLSHTSILDSRAVRPH